MTSSGGGAHYLGWLNTRFVSGAPWPDMTLAQDLVIACAPQDILRNRQRICEVTHIAPDSSRAPADWLTIVLVVVTLGVSVWTAGRLRAPPQAMSADRPNRVARSTVALAASCQLATSVAIVYLLILMV